MIRKYYGVLYEGLEHLWIWGSVGVLEPAPSTAGYKCLLLAVSLEKLTDKASYTLRFLPPMNYQIIGL